MCNDCCRQFKGWCKSFTRTEALLGALEAVLLIVYVAFLIFLIFHLVVCSPRTEAVQEVSTQSYENQTLTTNPDNITKETTQSPTLVTVECTWDPSKKTPASTRYYDPDDSRATQTMSTNNIREEIAVMSPASDIDELAFAEESDGEEAADAYRGLVVALVKLKPHGETTFGCSLTVVSERWTLTAASCLESIDMDSSPSFVMMEGYTGFSHGRTHAVVDVQVHPSYGGGNGSYDLACLKSRARLRGTVAELPTVLDYLLITIGEKFTLLVFGAFRSIPQSPTGGSLRQVHVYSLPAWQCAARARAARHLSRGRAVAHAACGAAPLCAGVLYARGVPCRRCAGAPLLRDATLLGVSGASCGSACEPARYVNVARVRDWVEYVIGGQ